MSLTLPLVLDRLVALSDPSVAASAATFGITAKQIYGVTVPRLRGIAQEIGRDHELAQQLWRHGSLETRELAALIDDPRLVTEDQMDRWAADFDSWAICDACCYNLFDRHPLAWKKVVDWSSSEKEYVKRAGFALMAALAVHNKTAPNKVFIDLLPIIKRESGDDRNFVKKGVNWALRVIGKRNLLLNTKALQTAHQIRAMNTKAGNWIASDAIRELSSDAVQRRLRAGLPATE